MKKESTTGDLLLENARLRAENETLQAGTRRMAQRIAYLELLLSAKTFGKSSKQ